MSKSLVAFAVCVPFLLAGCDKYEPNMKDGQVTETLIESSDGIVHAVAFVNDHKGKAVTQIRVTSGGVISMAKHDIPGYNPEIVTGKKVTLSKVYKEGPWIGMSRYIQRTCVHLSETDQRCGDDLY